MRLLLPSLFATLVLASCGGDDRPPPGRAVPSLRPGHEPRDGGAPQARPVPEVARPTSAPPPPPAVQPDAGTDRDFPAELRAMMGDVTSCMRWTPDAPPRVDVLVSVVVSQAGVVTRTTASGAGLSVEDIACLRTRASALRFTSPVPGAPRTVAATFEVHSQPPPTPGPPGPPTKVLRPGWAVSPANPGIPISGPPGDPIHGPAGDPIQGPAGDPIQGPAGDPIEGPAGTPIQGPAGIPIGQQ